MTTPLQRSRTFFGHQSVGGNLLDGLARLGSTNPALALNIHPFVDSRPLPESGLVEARIGRNADPRSKIDHFIALCEDGIGPWADVAFFKFCYVDITASSDIADILTSYQAAICHLQGRFPATRFLHLTMPLTAEPGLISRARSLLRGQKSRPQSGDNQARHRYNVALRTWAGARSEPLFDLAGLEATLPDGTMPCSPLDENCVPMLTHAWTYDGGHLNSQAADRMALELLTLLGNTVPQHHRE